MPFLAAAFTIAKLPILILAVCGAKDAVDLNRLIYLLLTIQLNHLTVFLVPLLPKPLHTDRGSQYTGKRFQSLLASYGMRSSMGDVGACWDNAAMERFWGSLKHEWLLRVPQSTRAGMKQDVADYIRY
ncbi:DDE-type integrase/transposase/recombinase [Salmonella enterica]|nr:DDE-type integrase/transposase/recombinase [Salmonella enterica subsp. enterica serovar Oranienburg]EIG7159502.1 DDE-type integrase/transposase/recombinase [Salmonella enterica]EIS5857319.1 DDE-type integrase/transposase/recombinase [Salmonella enterica]EJS2721592.1 DDE-type integrase/transposase/recombinase [Salmonella enterica]EKC8613787.1 DDE-type integrase/transposase/recombinase [Salmonella enterica]